MNKDANCTYKENKDPSITQLTDNLIVTKNLGNTRIDNGCTDTKSLFINGNKLIKFKNCTLTIGGRQFTASTKTVMDNFVVPYTNGYIRAEFQPTITMEMLHHRDLQQQKAIELIHYRIKDYGNTTLIVIISGICIISGALIVWRLRSSIIGFFRQRADSLLEGGGVTSMGPYVQPMNVSAPGTVTTLYSANPYLRAGVHYHANPDDTTTLHTTPVNPIITTI